MKIASLLLLLGLSLLPAAEPKKAPRVCPWAGVDPKKGAPRDIATLPDGARAVYSFMGAYAPHWVKSKKYSYQKPDGRYALVFYSKEPEDPDVELGFAEGAKRVRFELHGDNIARHSEAHAHFEVFKNGDWVKIFPPGVKPTAGHGTGWLPHEGAPPGFFMRSP